MSLEKIDIRCKYDPETVAFIDAEAEARGLERCEVMREILDQWRDAQKRKYIAIQKHCQARGLTGAFEGMTGQGEKKPLKWD